MGKYLAILDYTSVDRDGYNPVDKSEIFEFDLDEGRDPRSEHRKLVGERTRGRFIDGNVKSRLFRIAEEIRLD